MRYLVITRKAALAVFLAVLGLSFALAGVSQRLSARPASAGGGETPVYCVETDEKKLAVTFDAAWSAEDTGELLEILAEFDARATVFAVGDWVRQNPQSVRAFYEAGHTIGNHSDTHKAYGALSLEAQRADMEACSDAVEACVGVRPKVVRAPSGDWNADTVRAAAALGMQAVQWSVDSLDWQGLSAAEMVERVTAAAEPGAILLFHNGVENTPAALREILRILSADGYRFVPVEELLYGADARVDSAGRQYPA